LNNRARLCAEALEARDVPAVVTVERISDATEGGAAGVFRFTRTGDLSADLEFNFGTGGTADVGTDTAALNSVGFAAGYATTTMEVVAVADLIYDPDETVTVTLYGGTGYTVGTQDTATVTIADNTPVVTVARIADAVEGGSAGTFRFFRTGDLSAPLTVTFAVGGTATSGTDYTSIGTTVTFATDSATADVAVTAADESAADVDETVSVFVQNGTGYVSGELGAATLTIRDASTGVIAGRAWIDENQNGTRQSDEPGLSEVTVRLFQGTTLVAETTTDADGTYRFTGLAPASNYQVEFAPLSSDGATLTSDNVGTDDSIDSDPLLATGLTDLIGVAAGQVVSSVDAGFFLAAAPVPQVTVSFPKGVSNYYLRLQMTAGDQEYVFGPQLIRTHSGKDARALVRAALVERGWEVEAADDDLRLVIKGFKPAGGALVPVAGVVYTFYPAGVIPYEKPGVTRGGGATATEAAGPAGQIPMPAPGNSPGVFISFPPDVMVKVILTMTTAGGNVSASANITVNQALSTGARNLVFDELPNGWVAEKLGDGGILIKGKKKPDDTTDPVASFTVSYVGLGLGGWLTSANVHLSGIGGVTPKLVPQ
jgi:hypothetical protein